MFRNPKIYPKESSISILLYKNLKIIFHVLNNNFSYTQLFLFFFFRKISISIPMLLTLFYSERSLYLSRAFYLVFSFFFWKILVPFPSFFLKLFFVFFFDNTYFYICLQNFLIIILAFFLNFLHQNFLHQNLLHQNFFPSECFSKFLHQNFLHNQNFF